MRVSSEFVTSLLGKETGSTDHFLRFGGCLSAAIGGSLNVVLSSGFLKTIAVKCFVKTSLILGSFGLKSIGSIT